MVAKPKPPITPQQSLRRNLCESCRYRFDASFLHAPHMTSYGRYGGTFGVWECSRYEQAERQEEQS